MAAFGRGAVDIFVAEAVGAPAQVHILIIGKEQLVKNADLVQNGFAVERCAAAGAENAAGLCVAAGPQTIAALAGKAQNRHIIACVIGQLRLIVAQHQAADRKNLRVGVGGTDKLGQPVRLGKGVVVEQDGVLALGNRNALIYRVGKAGVVGVFDQGVAVAAAVAAGNRKAFIGGAVVDDDQLKILLGLCPDRLDGIPQPACTVQIRDDDRCFHGVSLPEIGVGVVVGETGVQHGAQHQRADQQERRKGDCHHGGADQIGARQPLTGGVAGAAEAPHQ